MINICLLIICNLKIKGEFNHLKMKKDTTKIMKPNDFYNIIEY
jgi:hypothetical protein